MNGELAAFLIELGLKSSVAFCILFAAMRVAGRLSASERHCAWMLAVLGLIALPVASALLPGVSLSVPRVRTAPAAHTGAAPAPSGALGAAGSPAVRSPGSRPPNAGPAAGRQATDGSADPAARRTARALRAAGIALAVVYAAGTLVLLGYFAVSVIRITVSLRRLAATDDPELVAALEDARRKMKIRRPVGLRVSARDPTPWAWGLFRPVVVLPIDFDTWPADARRNALLHELAHIRRLDFPTSLLAHLCRALYWFQPLAWATLKRVLAEAERACDDKVLLAGAAPASYAAQLHRVAEAVHGHGRRPPAATAMATAPSAVSQRIVSILDPKSRRSTVSAIKAFSMLLVVGAILAPLGAVRSQANAPAEAAPDAADFAAILRRGGAADSGELGVVVKTYTHRNDSEAAVDALVAYLSDPAHWEGTRTCRYCSSLLAALGAGAPSVELEALLGAFQRIEERAYAARDGNLLVRLAAVSAASRNREATSRGLRYLLEGFQMSDLTDDSKLAAVSFLSDMGQYRQARALAERLDGDSGSTLYGSASTQRWIKFLDAQIQRSNNIAARLLASDGHDASANADYLPLVKTAPVYPQEAARRGEEGSVIVEFTVTTRGTTKDVHVVRSTDPVFEKAAVSAAGQFLYAPRLVDGTAVDIPNVRNKITFVLEQH